MGRVFALLPSASALLFALACTSEVQDFGHLRSDATPRVDAGDGTADVRGDGDASTDTGSDTVIGPDASIETCACPAGFVCDDSGACVEHVCGNGQLEPGETCDPPESCPTSCDDAQACSTDSLVGRAADCSAACEHLPVVDCASGDACCPSGCDSATDADCSDSCGDGVLQALETCDPPATCPADCDDGDSCTSDQLLGSAAACSAVCQHEPVSTCVDEDGCCPAGCNGATDSDCASVCGNGIVEPQETCDPPLSCPTSCRDANPCVIQALMGSAQTCDAACISELVVTCRNGDGCCAAGCTALNDAECAATCGNGMLEGGETCDPPSSCPVCDDHNACTIDAQSGDPATCTVSCATFPITACNGKYGQPGKDSCCPAGCTGANDSDCKSACGNSVVEPGETCDPPGSCASCNDQNACTTDTATGSAAACTLACTHQPRTACASGDGCCPAQCNRTNDSDCPAVCGNSVVELGETCDPPGSCQSCNDGNTCTVDTTTGAAATCNLACGHQAVTACRNADGCCPAGCSALTDSDCAVRCGNGAVEAGETCDPPGSCPTSCNDGKVCTTDTLVGAAATCTARCTTSTVTACVGGDGCCVPGCNPSDRDCGPNCGNGVVDLGETCDPPGSCPTSCNDGNACTNDALSGSAVTCTAKCTSSPVACRNGDGCCPSGCSALADNDCPASCGNGIIEPGETCDPPGSCPTSCNDGAPCTKDTLTGSAASCNAACSVAPISACLGGNDGCCPAACVSGNDGDCASGCGGVCASGDGCCPSGCNLLSDSDCSLDCTNDATWPTAWRDFEDQVLTLTNQRRAAGATCGTTSYPPAPPLAFDPLLRIAARCHSFDMADNGYFSHTGFDGSLPDERVSDTGYVWQTMGENIAAGHPTPADVVAGWMASPSHCHSIMAPEFSELGVGFVAWPDSTYLRYWTQDFATPQ